MPYNPLHVPLGPGTLYAAPIGTTEPTSVTGAWGAGWQPLGYTEQGSQLQLKPAFAAVTVEEELWDLFMIPSGYSGDLAFALAEQTVPNFLLVLNAGLGAGQVTGTSGTNPDGSMWVEQPDLGREARVMLGWDHIPKAAASATTTFGRLICRQCIQTGQITMSRRKGNTKTTLNGTFSLEKPAGAEPFRYIFPPALIAV